MTTEYCLHLIASTPSHGATHVDPDSTACLLGTYTSKSEARWAGRAYLAQHPAAWVQTQNTCPGLTFEIEDMRLEVQS